MDEVRVTLIIPVGPPLPPHRVPVAIPRPPDDTVAAFLEDLAHAYPILSRAPSLRLFQEGDEFKDRLPSNPRAVTVLVAGLPPAVPIPPMLKLSPELIVLIASFLARPDHLALAAVCKQFTAPARRCVLSACIPPSAVSLERVMWPNLRRLDISGAQHATNAVLSLVSQKCPLLEELDMSWIQGVDSLEPLSLPHLEVLSINACYRLSPQRLFNPASLPQLKDVTVTHGSPLGPALASLSRSLRLHMVINIHVHTVIYSCLVKAVNVETTVKVFKKTVADRLHISSTSPQHLVYKGKLIEQSGTTLRECCIADGDDVRLQ